MHAAAQETPKSTFLQTTL